MPLVPFKIIQICNFILIDMVLGDKFKKKKHWYFQCAHTKHIDTNQVYSGIKCISFLSMGVGKNMQ